MSDAVALVTLKWLLQLVKPLCLSLMCFSPGNMHVQPIIAMLTQLCTFLLCSSRMSSRCLWDADTDNYAEDVFMNVGTSFRSLTLTHFCFIWGGLTTNRASLALLVQDNLFCAVVVFGSYYY